MCPKISSAKWRPFWPAGDELMLFDDYLYSSVRFWGIHNVCPLKTQDDLWGSNGALAYPVDSRGRSLTATSKCLRAWKTFLTSPYGLCRNVATLWYETCLLLTSSRSYGPRRLPHWVRHHRIARIRASWWLVIGSGGRDGAGTSSLTWRRSWPRCLRDRWLAWTEGQSWKSILSLFGNVKNSLTNQTVYDIAKSGFVHVTLTQITKIYRERERERNGKGERNRQRETDRQTEIKIGTDRLRHYVKSYRVLFFVDQGSPVGYFSLVQMQWSTAEA